MSESLISEVLRDCNFITFSPNKLKAIISSWLELLVQEQLICTLWLKFPSNFLGLVDSYIHQKYVEEVYLYGEFPSRILHKKTIWVDITKQSSLVKEIFFVLRSNRLSGLLFAHTEETGEFQLTFNFESGICQNFLERLQDSIAISDQTTLEVLTGQTSLGWPKSSDSGLITNLLLKQTKALEETKDDTSHIPKLKKVIEAQDDFLQQLSQQMRLPLTNMKTALSLLKSTTLKLKQRQRYLEIVQSQWQLQFILWSALVEWAEIKRIYQDINFAKANCELELVLFNVIALYQSIAQDKMITLEYDLPVGLPKVRCPNFYLQRVLSHLLDNSLKFTPDGGKISLSCCINFNKLELTILDTGIGIKKNELDKIFNSFYRGHNPNKDHFGLGLGLSIVKRILDYCDGYIDIRSTVNQGSRVKVILPICIS